MTGKNPHVDLVVLVRGKSLLLCLNPIYLYNMLGSPIYFWLIYSFIDLEAFLVAMNILFQAYIFLRNEAPIQLRREENVTYFILPVGVSDQPALISNVVFSNGGVYIVYKKCAACRNVWRRLSKYKQRQVLGLNDERKTGSTDVTFDFMCAQEAKL